jgi:hypothetical protein
LGSGVPCPDAATKGRCIRCGDFASAFRNKELSRRRRRDQKQAPFEGGYLGGHRDQPQAISTFRCDS